jgi:tetratricopeptide (TPR) repeat protein
MHLLQQSPPLLRVPPEEPIAVCARPASHLNHGISHTDVRIRTFPVVGTIGRRCGILSQSVRLAPDNAEAHSNLCYALLHAGRVDEAVDQCRDALRVRPGYPDAQYNLKNALALAAMQ